MFAEPAPMNILPRRAPAGLNTSVPVVEKVTLKVNSKGRRTRRHYILNTDCLWYPARSHQVRQCQCRRRRVCLRMFESLELRRMHSCKHLAPV